MNPFFNDNETVLDELLTVSQAISIRVLSLESLAELTVDGAAEKLTEMADNDPGIDPYSVAENQILRRQLLDAIEDLPERERQIIRHFYIESRSLKRISHGDLRSWMGGQMLYVNITCHCYMSYGGCYVSLNVLGARRGSQREPCSA